MKNKKIKKSTSASKIITAVSLIQFIGVIVASIICAITGVDNSLFCYLIPTSGALTTASCSFYYNKSKTENLSKQRIRYVYLKLLLQEKLSPETYMEIEQDLCNIDSIIDNKLIESLNEAIQKEADDTIL